MAEIIEALIYEKESGSDNREYSGRFIGIVSKEQTSAIINNPILQKRLTHLPTKKLKSMGKYSDAKINNMRAVLVVNKIEDKDVTKFLYFTELIDSVVHASDTSVHMLTKYDSYVMFTVLDEKGNYKL